MKGVHNAKDFMSKYFKQELIPFQLMRKRQNVLKVKREEGKKERD